MSNVLKILPVGAEFFHADGRTDMTKLIAALHHFANAPETCKAVTGPPYEIFWRQPSGLMCEIFTAA